MLTYEHIKKVRPIAENIDDTKRIQSYITESIDLDVVPSMSFDVWQDIEEYITKGTTKGVLTVDMAKNMANGCEFVVCGKNQQHKGVIMALSYLTYSRFIKNNDVNVTAFGVRIKETAFSDRVDNATVIRQANEAYNIGMAYLNGSIAYLNTIIPTKTTNKRKLKFKSIG